MTNASGSAAERRWRGLVEEQERSGLSVREFAERRGVSAWSLYGWRSKLGRPRQRRGGRRSGQTSRDALIPVDVVREALVGGDDHEVGFEVIVDERARVRVPRSFDVTELARVLEAVRRSC